MNTRDRRNRKAIRKVLYSLRSEGYKNSYNGDIYNSLSKKLKTWFK
ncbi:MAG: hypothetical protein ACFFDY_00250 [Candidatus Thorarchaeota archaeon]